MSNKKGRRVGMSKEKRIFLPTLVADLAMVLMMGRNGWKCIGCAAGIRRAARYSPMLSVNRWLSAAS
jgi:hypothetical protein